MKEIIKTMLYAVIFSICTCLTTIHLGENIELIYYMLQVVGLGRSRTIAIIFTFCINMLPFFACQILLGMQLYSRFCTASVYFFSRQEKRLLWFRREVAILLGKSITYTLTYIVFLFAIRKVMYQGTVTIEGIQLLCYMLIYLSLYIFTFSLLLNACSVFVGNYKAFILLYTVQIVLIVAMMLPERIPESGIWHWLFKINPVANIVVPWHSSSTLFPQYLNGLSIQWNLNTSVIYLISLALLITVISGLFMCKTDISLENKEDID